MAATALEWARSRAAASAIPPTSRRAITSGLEGKPGMVGFSQTRMLPSSPDVIGRCHCRRDVARARCGLAEQTRSEPPASDRQALRRMSTNMQLGRHSMAPLVSSREHASAFGTKGSPSPGGHCLRLGEWRWTGSFVSRSSGPPPAAVNSGNRRSTSTQLSERVGSIGAGRGIGRIRSASTCSGYGSDALAGRLPGETALARSGQDRTQPCSSPVARRGSPRRRGWDVQPRWVVGG